MDDAGRRDGDEDEARQMMRADENRIDVQGQRQRQHGVHRARREGDDAGILEARTAFTQLGSSAIPAIAIGTAVAAVTGYVSIAWFLKWLGSHSLFGFAVYRIACGAALLASLAAGFLRRV